MKTSAAEFEKKTRFYMLISAFGIMLNYWYSLLLVIPWPLTPK